MILMDHTYRRIINFIKYRPNITPITFGEFIDDAQKNPQKYKQNFWAVNCALDQFPAMTLAQVVRENGLHSNCVFMTSDSDIVDSYRDLNFRYFPYFMAEGIAQIKTSNDLENPEITFGPRANVLSCVNRFARFHRVYVYYKLSKQPNLANAKVSFTRLETILPDEHGILHPVELSLDQMLDVAKLHKYYTDDFESWLTAEFPHLPRQIEEYDNTDNKYDNWVKSVAFTESYANIVTETYVDDFVPTEKVVKPLLAGCLFMPTSSKGYMKKLEAMGFDVKFDGIDHSLYDSLHTWQERCDSVINLANNIYPDIVDIWHNNIDRLEYNRELFFSQRLEEHVICDVRDIFELNY
jgi:hypothetical protein